MRYLPMNNSDLAMIVPVLRHVLQIGAGALVAKGAIDESVAQQLVGLGVSVGTLIWYGWSKKKHAVDKDLHE